MKQPEDICFFFTAENEGKQEGVKAWKRLCFASLFLNRL